MSHSSGTLVPDETLSLFEAPSLAYSQIPTSQSLHASSLPSPPSPILQPLPSDHALPTSASDAFSQSYHSQAASNLESVPFNSAHFHIIDNSFVFSNPDKFSNATKTVDPETDAVSSVVTGTVATSVGDNRIADAHFDHYHFADSGAISAPATQRSSPFGPFALSTDNAGYDHECNQVRHRRPADSIAEQRKRRNAQKHLIADRRRRSALNDILVQLRRALYDKGSELSTEAKTSSGPVGWNV
jgi:hypothetical protein